MWLEWSGIKLGSEVFGSLGQGEMWYVSNYLLLNKKTPQADFEH